MHLSKNMAKAAVIILAISMAAFTLQIIPIQPAEAQLAAQQPVSGPLPSGVTPDRITNTVSSLSFRPVVVGVGQEVLVNFWINPALASNNVLVPKGFEITITKPDGTKDVRTVSSEPATGANWFTYVPETVGEFKIKFDFLGTYYPKGIYWDGNVYTAFASFMTGTSFSAPANYTVSSYYKPSSTKEQTLTVQQDMVWSWYSPLPTDYWTRPASLNNREWWPLLGNYPPNGYVGFDYANWDTLYPDTTKQYNSLADFVPWVKAPNTAHIAWKRQGAIAGLIGGPATQYGTTSSPGGPSLIYAGRCYQTVTKANGTSVAQCYDLRTGEIYYEIPGGITPNIISYDNPEADPTTIAGQEIASDSWSVELLSLSGSYLRKINPWTGALAGNYSIAPLSGGNFHNQVGGYVLNIQDLGSAAGANRYRLINWTTRGTSTNFTTRIVSNTTYLRSSLPTLQDFENDLGAQVSSISGVPSQPFNIRWTIKCEFYKLSTGQLLYNISTTDYPDILYHPSPVMIDHGKVAAWTGGGYYAIFDGFTGKWFRSETSDYPWSTTGFGAYAISSGYGLVFRYAYDAVYAYNWADGKLAWQYKAPAGANFESPYTDENGTEVYSFNGDGDIADGKLYVSNSEHTTTWPITRGWGIHCINITTGELLWKLNNPMSFSAVADGYMVATNSWDGYMYVFGKGKTATTVTAPDVVVAKGSGVVIKGTVLDMSPAQPNTPCVSKESMTIQMEHLHLQMPVGGQWQNETLTGVPVTLTAIDASGSAIDIGTVTTNGYYGTFSKAWTPPVEGDYEIIASFAGDDSYASSAASTAVSVGPAPAEIIIPEQATPVDYTNTIIGAAIAVIIAFAIGIAIAVLTLRKR